MTDNDKLNSLDVIVDCTDSIRLDCILAKEFKVKGFSRGKVKKAILSGFCCIDGFVCRDPSRKVSKGERIFCQIPQTSSSLLLSSCDEQVSVESSIEVVYEDDDLAIINKPAGITVHPCPSCENEETLVHRLIARFPSIISLGGVRPGIVHRLDKDTSGLMIIALSSRGYNALINMFANHEVHKTYLALVRGIIPKEGKCALFIGRDQIDKTKMAAYPNDACGAKSAYTEYFRLYTDSDGLYSLVSVKIFTGRTHQIRVHMSKIGHPILGDATYGCRQNFVRPCGVKTPDPAKRQMLHAWKLDFEHPFTHDKMSFSILPPNDFFEVQGRLLNRMLRIIITGLPGCGKSLFSKFLSEYMPVWSADTIVAELYRPCGVIASELKRRYGDRYIDESGAVAKKKLLADMINGCMHREIENLVHPFVVADLEKFFNENEERGCPFVAAEVPLWFESEHMEKIRKPQVSTEYSEQFKNLSSLARHLIPKSAYPSIKGELSSCTMLVVGISCPREVRINRLKTIRHWDDDVIATMDSWQWSEDKKMSSCDLIIANDKTIDDLKKASGEFYASLENRNSMLKNN